MKWFLAAFMFVLAFASTFAVAEQPAAVDSATVFSIVPPVPPVDTECTELYSILDSWCSGNIRLYNYCAPTMQEGVGVIERRSENCRDYGDTWLCVGSDCVDTGTVQTDYAAVYGFLIVAAAVFAIYKIKKRGKKK